MLRMSPLASLPTPYFLHVTMLLSVLGCLDLPETSEANTLVPDASRGMADPDAQSDTGIDVDFDGLMADAQHEDMVDMELNENDGMLQVDAENAVCGDGIVQVGEECDAAGPSDTCSDACLLVECGNARVDPGEYCDDGNDNNDDGCIENCQVYFPDRWVTVLEDPALDGNAVAHSSCAMELPDELAGVNEFRGQLDGRYAYLMWARKHFHWVRFAEPLEQPTRISLNMYVPDGFERRMKLSLSYVDGVCDDSPTGAELVHQDLGRESDPPVEVYVRVLDETVAELNDTGVPDAWVNAAFEIHPPSGYVRIWYNDTRVAQVRIDPQRPFQALRFYARYAEGSRIRGAMGLEGFTVQHGAP